MKKSLLGLVVALAAFFMGVSAAGIFQVEPKAISTQALEVFKFHEVQTFKAEPLINEIEESSSVAAVERQDFDGWYTPENNKKMPEVNTIKLSGSYIDSDGNLPDEMDLYAGIYTELSDDVDKGFAEAVWTKFNGNKVKFKTKKLKGIVYRFEGNFFKNKTSGAEGEKILRGTLQKFVKGKKVAEISGDFEFNQPYCLH